MRFKPDKKYVHWGLTAFIVAVCIILFIFAVFNYPVFAEGFSSIIKVLLPVINGFLIAYLLNPVMKWYELKVLPGLLRLFGKNIPEKVKGKRIIRFFSVALSVITVLLILACFIWILIPQLVSSITSIAKQFPEYARNLYDYSQKLFDDNPVFLQYFNQYYENFQSWSGNLIESLPSYANKLLSTLTSGLFKSISFVYNLVIGLILSIYILTIKEKFLAQCRKVIVAYFNRKRAKSILDDLHSIDVIFRDYIVSSIVDSVLIGFICFILCLIMRVPYTILISFIIGITNIIPFFGPFIGGIPCAFIILLIDPVKSLYFIIMIIILQQLDGNLIKPKLFGDSTGLSAFWVVVSIIVGGGLFGVPGMYLGTPVFAVIYNYFKRHVSNKLRAKGLPADTESYVRSGELPYKIPKEELVTEVKVTNQLMEKIKETISHDDSEQP